MIECELVTLETAEKAVIGVQTRCKAEIIEVLQEIRQEIDKWHHLTDKAINDGIDTALEIIDKRIKEIEEI